MRSLRSRVSRDPTKEQLARVKRMALRVAKLRGKSRREHQIVLADYLEEIGHPTPNALKTGRKVLERWAVFNFSGDVVEYVGDVTIRVPEVLFGTKRMVFRVGNAPRPAKVHVGLSRHKSLFQALKRERFLAADVKTRHVWWAWDDDDNVLQLNASERGRESYGRPLLLLRRVRR